MRLDKRASFGCVLLERGDVWPINNPRYRGVCRGRWWPLEKHTESDEEAARLTELLSVHLMQQYHACLPQVTDDGEFLMSYAAACERLGVVNTYALLCRSPQGKHEPKGWLRSMLGSCNYLGFDVSYPSGNYSFIDGDYGAKDRRLMAYLRANLNEHGLFIDLDRALAFTRLQAQAVDSCSLESLDDATPIELWEDTNLVAMRVALGTRHDLG